MDQTYYVYILASRRNGTLYIGVTGDLASRCWQHRNGEIKGFTKRYGVHQLVHMEPFADVRDAIAREKAMKKWRRAWKQALIEQGNPQWLDLCDQING
ncbi:MAG: GIY-YIG nuclease family protein [Sphingopyxis sp.]